MAKVRDMTKGSPVGHIIAFSVPLLLGNMFQQMYSLVDTAVVGKICGVEALAAVGSAGWLDWLVLGFVIGLTQGFAILISQRFGAGDMKGMRKAVAMSAYITVAAIMVITTISLLLCGKVLHWMNTPVESYDLALSYVRVIFMGIPVTMCYNLFGGMLRALGDSRTPLIAMVIAALANVALDFLFVAKFGMGVEGAALATVLGQLFSAVFCFIAVLRVKALRLTKDDWKIDAKTLRLLAKLAVFNGAAGLMVLSMAFVFNMQAVMAEYAAMSAAMLAAFVVLANVTLLLYDRVLLVMMAFYLKKLRPRLMRGGQ